MKFVTMCEESLCKDIDVMLKLNYWLGMFPCKSFEIHLLGMVLAGVFLFSYTFLFAYALFVPDLVHGAQIALVTTFFVLIFGFPSVVGCVISLAMSRQQLRNYLMIIDNNDRLLSSLGFVNMKYKCNEILYGCLKGVILSIIHAAVEIAYFEIYYLEKTHVFVLYTMYTLVGAIHHELCLQLWASFIYVSAHRFSKLNYYLSILSSLPWTKCRKQQIETLICAHNRLTSSLPLVLESFSSSILLIYVESLVVLIVAVYRFIAFSFQDLISLKSLLMITWALPYARVVYISVSAADNVRHQASLFRVTLRNAVVNNMFQEEDNLDLIKYYSNSPDTITFSIKGLFQLNYSLLTSISGLTISYIVLLMQWNNK